MQVIETRKTIAVVVVALTLTGCAGDWGPKTGAGATVGAVSGGLIGYGVGRGPGAVLTGAVIGGLIGGAIGNTLDEEDRRRAHAATMHALEFGGPGAPHSWRGERGAYGTIVPGPPYAQGSYDRCRAYTHTIYVQGRPQSARGVACRNPDGSWSAIS